MYRRFGAFYRGLSIVLSVAMVSGNVGMITYAAEPTEITVSEDGVYEQDEIIVPNPSASDAGDTEPSASEEYLACATLFEALPEEVGEDVAATKTQLEEAFAALEALSEEEQLKFDEEHTDLMEKAYALSDAIVNAPKVTTYEEGRWIYGTWTLDDEGKLTISGDGELNSFVGNPPDQSQVKTIVITGNVTSIGGNMFQDYSNLTSIDLGNSVQTIEMCAFKNCTNLKSVTVTDSVKNIGDMAFADCSSITEISIGSGITEIGNGAFLNCKNVNSLVISDEATTVTIAGNTFYNLGSNASNLSIRIPGSTGIDTGAFGGTIQGSCKSFTVTNTLTMPIKGAESGNNIVYEFTKNNTDISSANFDGKNATIKVNSGATLTITGNIEIPAGVTLENSGTLVIAEGVSITNNGTIKNVGSGSITGQEQITNGEGASTIVGNGTWENVNWVLDNVGTLTISGNGAMPNADFGGSGFNGFSSDQVKIIKINGVSSIGEANFARYPALTSVEIGDTVQTIGDSAFTGCTSLTGVSIPKSVTKIGEQAFYGCTKLEKFEISDLASGVTIGSEAIKSSKKMQIKIPGSAVIANDAFPNAKISNLTLTNTLTMPDLTGFDSLEQTIFEITRNTTVSSASIPENAAIKVNAGATLTIAGDIIIPAGVTLENSGTLAVAENGHITNKGTIQNVGSGSITGQERITNGEGASVIIESGYITDGAFTWTLDNEGTLKISGTESGRVDDFTDTVVNKSQVKKIIIDGASVIYMSGFYKYPALTTVEIGKNVQEIGMGAFQNCRNLETVTLPDNGTLESIGMRAFFNCVNLSSISIPDDVESIGESAFYNCINLSGISIPDSVTKIALNAFSSCYSLSQVKIGSGIQEIGDRAFDSCYKLEKFEISDLASNVKIGSEVLDSDCSMDVKIPGSAEIAADAFKAAEISTFTLTDTLTVPVTGAGSIDHTVFEITKDTTLTTADIPRGAVIKVDAGATLTLDGDITIPDDVTIENNGTIIIRGTLVYGGTIPGNVKVEAPGKRAYPVIYKWNDEILSGLTPNTITESEGIAELPTPADKSNYRFEGWYCSADFTGGKVTSVPAGAAPVTLYAKWIPISSNTISWMNTSTNKSRAYDGNAIAISEDKNADFTWNGDGTATIDGYYTKSEDGSDTFIKTTTAGSGAAIEGGAPKKLGTYYAFVTVTEGAADNVIYRETSAYLEFQIIRAAGTITNKDYAVSYVYEAGQTVPAPRAANFTTNSDAQLTFTWYRGNYTDVTQLAASNKLDSAPTDYYADGYTLHVHAEAGTNHTAADCLVQVMIDKAAMPSVSIRLNDRIYDGTEQNAISSITGAPSGSTITYNTSSDNRIWSDDSETEPKMTNIGTLYVKVRVTHPNYNQVSCSLSATIRPLVADESAVLAPSNAGTEGWYHGAVTIQAPTGYYISTAQTAASFTDESIIVSTDQNGAFTYYLKQKSTGYITGEMTIPVKIDTVLPTAKVTVKEGWWQSFLETVSFGLYTNTEDTITIDAEDTKGTANSGIGTVEYYISSIPYEGRTGLDSLTALGESVWMTYHEIGKPKVSQNTLSYVYARVTDKAGNVNYLSTDGIVCDITAPTLNVTLSGTEYTEAGEEITGAAAAAYTGAVTAAVTASDEAAAGQNTLDGISYTLDNGTETAIASGASFQITGRGSHTVAVTATDKAGNERKETQTIRIYGAAPALTITPSSSIVYDGAPLADGTDFTLNKGGSNGSVSWSYKNQGAEDDTYAAGLPGNAGSYTIKASLAEDYAGCYPAATCTANLTIAQAAPKITLSTSLNRKGGTSILLTATVEKVEAGTVPSGSVTFYDTTNGGDTVLSTAALASDGTAAYTYAVSKQKVYRLKAVYAGDGNYETVTSAEQRVNTIKKDTGNSDGDSSDSDDSGTGTTPAQPTPVTPTPVAPTPAAPAPVAPTPTTPTPVAPTPAPEPTQEEKKEPVTPAIEVGTSPEDWEKAKDEVVNAPDGSKVTINMTGTTSVPGDLIESIKGKDVDVVFDLGNGMTWTINGKSITGDNIGTIDFAVNKGSKKIPVDVINEITGEHYSIQISLAYDGDFGFTATLTINMESKNAGNYANLFYYNDETEGLEFMDAGLIAEDGTTELTFTHASDYTIVVSDKIMDETEDAARETEEAAPAADATTKETAAVKPEESTNPILWIILGILAAAGIGGGMAFWFRKKEKEEK